MILCEKDIGMVLTLIKTFQKIGPGNLVANKYSISKQNKINLKRILIKKIKSFKSK